MGSITINKDVVDRSRDFILQYMRDAGYQGSLEDGTGAYDILIKGFSLLAAMVDQQVTKATGYLSLDRAQELKALLGDEYDEAVDAILSNWFVSRKGGRPTQGVVRVWFMEPPEFLQLKAGEPLFSAKGAQFTPINDYVLTQNDFNQVVNKPLYREEYFYDVQVESVEKQYFDVPDGDEVKPYINNIYVLRAAALGDFTPGVDKESSEAFISRTEQAITTRELITDRAINTVLTEEYDEVRFLYTAGIGKPEQLRDLKTFEGVLVHVGNKADIYVSAPYAKRLLEAVAPADGVIPLEDVQGEPHHVAFVLDVLDEHGESVAFTVTDTEPETGWGGADNAVTVHVDPALEGAQLTVSFLQMDVVKRITTEVVRSEQRRVACYDPWVKSMFPVVLKFDLRLDLRGASLDEKRDDITKVIKSYVNGEAFNATYAESAFVRALHDGIPELRRVVVPVGCTATLFDPLSMEYKTVDCGDALSLDQFLGASHQVSENTTHLYTDESLITLSEET